MRPRVDAVSVSRVVVVFRAVAGVAAPVVPAVPALGYEDVDEDSDLIWLSTDLPSAS